MKENKRNAASGKITTKQQKKSVTKRRNKRNAASEKKMLALITLASGIAQDFNEILATIMGSVSYTHLTLPTNREV